MFWFMQACWSYDTKYYYYFLQIFFLPKIENIWIRSNVTRP